MKQSKTRQNHALYPQALKGGALRRFSVNHRENQTGGNFVRSVWAAVGGGPMNKRPGQLFNDSPSRRNFLKKTAAAALGFSIVPRWVLGGAGYVPPSDKLNIAFVGVGSQGLRVMLRFLRQPDVQAVAVCDPNKMSANYPQWDTHEFCNLVRALLGVGTGWDWLSPDDPIQLTHSLRVTSGVSGREPCQKIVDAYYGTQQRSGHYHSCSAYIDFRELLEEQKDVDAVVVCTTDNLHAAVSAAAMKKHKHVFCQKPLTHTIYEARRIAEIAKETGLATQIAVANQASEDTRLLCEWIWDGAIGPVREVSNWSSRPFWPQRPEELEESRPFKGDGEEGDEGLLFVGDRGKILCGFNGKNPKLIPQSKMDSYKQPPKTLPRSPGNEREWLDACRGSKVKPGGNFEFSGMVTETLLLGNVAARAGQKLVWDRANLKITNSDLAQKFVRPERRSGWEL